MRDSSELYETDLNTFLNLSLQNGLEYHKSYHKSYGYIGDFFDFKELTSENSRFLIKLFQNHRMKSGRSLKEIEQDDEVFSNGVSIPGLAQLDAKTTNLDAKKKSWRGAPKKSIHSKIRSTLKFG